MSNANHIGDDHPIWEELKQAFNEALTKHRSMYSPHEGYSVILEELDELWDHVKADTGHTTEARKEALQVASMGLRYALDLTENPYD
jgi:hypothetical protein